MTKKLFYSVLVVFTILMFNSCNKSAKDLASNAFDYCIYNCKESLFYTLEKINFNNSELKSGLSKFEATVRIINTEYGTDVYISEFDQFLANNPNASIGHMLNEGFITQMEYDVVTLFFSFLESYNFEESIENLKSSILAMNLESFDFKKYNDFVNSLLIINDYYLEHDVDIFSQNTMKSATVIRAGCAVAVASNSVATISLASCSVPGPWYALAVVGKGLALAGLYFSCP